VPVRIEGSLMRPQLKLDEAGIAARLLTGVAGALVFPPAGLAALADLGTGAQPCVAIAKGLASQPAAAGGPAAAVEPSAEAVKRTIKDLRKGLKGLFGGN
jgi:hypothetical protein